MINFLKFTFNKKILYAITCLRVTFGWFKPNPPHVYKLQQIIFYVIQKIRLSDKLKDLKHPNHLTRPELTAARSTTPKGLILQKCILAIRVVGLLLQNLSHPILLMN